MHDVDLGPLPPLPSQPPGVRWPTEEWPESIGALDETIGELLDEIFADRERYGVTYATAVVWRGTLVHERYDNALEHLDRPAEPVVRETCLLSWSMAKSMVHAAVGLLVGDGRLALSTTPPVPEWRTAGDSRAAITLDQLLAMRDGLDFVEDYVDDRTSDVIEMLFGSGRADVAHYAASRPPLHAPGEVFNYSSGTTNIVARIVGDTIGSGRVGMESFLHDRLFGPIGMRSAQPTFDDAGTFVGSSYVYATARDFARFGLLYLRDGVWDGVRLLPEGWVDHGRRARSVDTTDGRLHGSHWWVVNDELGSFWASGYDGQSILCVPGLDLIVVRLGKTPDGPVNHLERWRARVTEAAASEVRGSGR